MLLTIKDNAGHLKPVEKIRVVLATSPRQGLWAFSDDSLEDIYNVYVTILTRFRLRLVYIVTSFGFFVKGILNITRHLIRGRIYGLTCIGMGILLALSMLLSYLSEHGRMCRGFEQKERIFTVFMITLINVALVAFDYSYLESEITSLDNQCIATSFNLTSSSCSEGIVKMIYNLHPDAATRVMPFYAAYQTNAVSRIIYESSLIYCIEILGILPYLRFKVMYMLPSLALIFITWITKLIIHPPLLTHCTNGFLMVLFRTV